jgi:DNA replication protein DnaC
MGMETAVMGTLSDALQQGELQGEIPTGAPPAEAAPTERRSYLQRLIRLPSTSELQAAINRAQTRLAQEMAKPETKVGLNALKIGNAKREVEISEKRLREGVERDFLQAERPDGCWCLGEGGAEFRYHPLGVQVFGRYCECGDAQRVKAEITAAIEAERRALRQRENARIWQAAAVPNRFAAASFDTYPGNEANRDAVAKIRTWATPPDPQAEDGEAAWDTWYAERRKSLFLWGPFGTGKTGLAVSALREWIGHFGGEQDCLFMTVPNLLDRIRSTYGPSTDSTERQVLESVKSVGLLVLDDLGAERVTDWVAEKLFTIINHRHDEDLETIFTSNLNIAELASHIGERTTWRIVEMCEVVHIDGPNLRDRR